MRAPAMPERLLFTAEETALCALDEGPLSGLRHRTLIDAQSGACALALWQEEHTPGFNVPAHRHDCEEIITIIDGEIRAFIEDRYVVARSGQSILIPEWALHGFCVTSDIAVRLLAIFGSASPSIFRGDGQLSLPPWLGGASDHLADEPAANQNLDSGKIPAKESL